MDTFLNARLEELQAFLGLIWRMTVLLRRHRSASNSERSASTWKLCSLDSSS